MKPKLTKLLSALISSLFAIVFLQAQTTTPLDDYILGQMNALKLPGVVIAIVKDNKMALTRGYGYADIDKDIQYTPNTIQEIASISKPVTATAAMQLWEHGYFQLDQAIDDFIPFTVRNPNFPGAPITFRMLMNHTSSIVGNHLDPGDNPPGGAMPLGVFLQNFLSPGGSLYKPTKNYENFAPGTQYQYSNIAFALLGYLVERISGMPFNVYCNQHIFQPLCMNSTRWYYSELDTNVVARPYRRNAFNGDYKLYEIPDYPGGQLKTSIIDLSRFMLMHGNYGILDGVRIIDSTTEVMMRHHETLLLDDSTYATVYQGLPWEIVHDYRVNKDLFGKDGSHPGVRTRAYFNVTDKTTELVFTNGEEDVLPIFFTLDQIVKDTVATPGKASLNCSYHFNPCQQNSEYWKNHQPEWAISSVPMKLGSKDYYDAGEIISLLNRPDNGDASNVLAKALITAKFNVAQGSELAPIVLTINSAMDLIGSHKLPFSNPVPFSSQTGIQMLTAAATLTFYNLGNMNTTSCTGTLPLIARVNKSFELDEKSNSLSVFPNPVSSSTKISFTLSMDENVSIQVFDVNGKLIRTILENHANAGTHQLEWNGNDERGNLVNAGVYFLKMHSDNSLKTIKILVLR